MELKEIKSLRKLSHSNLIKFDSYFLNLFL